MRIFTLVSGVILCQLVQLAFIDQVEAQEVCGDVTCGANAKCKKQKKQAPRCACEAGFIGDGFNCVEACACSSHGDPHYIQYDNRKFDFQGDCSYLFSARDEVSKPECNFRAVVKNYKKDDTSDVSLTRSLTVTLGNTTVIKMGPEAELRVNGEVQDPSYSSHPDFKMAFYDRSQWLILKNCDILFGYGRHKATAFISKALGGNAYGLCGNCNGNDDDCTDSTGAQHNDGSGECNGLSVGQSWLVPNPSADPPETKDTCVVEDVKADCLEETLLEARTTYCDLVDITNTDSPWTAAYASNEEYVAAANEAFDTCLMDVCVKLEEGGDAEELACNAMSDFVAQVEETIIDGSMPAWRSDERCPITCDEPNQQYFDALPCERSCANPENPTCPLGSVGGCGCMEGFYRSGQDCVPIEECGCQYRGSYYPIGERVMRKTCKEEYECQLVDGTPTMVKAQVFPGCLKTAECKLNEQGRYQCHCKKGMAGDGVTSCTAGCGPKDLLCGANSRCVQDKKTKEYSCQCNDGFSGDGEICYEVCGCKHKGDPHTTPFDGGKTRHFQGNCTYLLTEMYDPAECKFVVWAKHQSSNKKAVSTTMEITVFVKGAKIFIGQGLKVLVNGLAVRGDVEFDDVTDYAIREEGSFVVVYTRCGSSVGFDGKTTVLIDVPKQYGEQLKGLCGNCNGKDDDFTTYDGEPVSPDTPNRYTAWGKTYQVNQANDEPYCQTGPTDDIGEEESCPPESAEAAAAAKACRKLRNPNGPFKDCLALGKKMSDRSAEIFGDCVFDYCAFNGDPVKQQSMLCEKMGEMSNECARESVVVNWRTDRFCPAAEDLGCKKANFLTYSPNVPACRKTCKYQKPRKKCRGKPSEGCECSRDDYVFDEDRCVPKSQCGCKYKNGYFPVGSTVVEKGCKKQRTCVHKKGRSKFKVKKMKGCNKKTESCELVDGGYKCQCKNGFEKKKGKCVESCGGKKCPKNAKCTKRKKCKCKRGFQWSDNKKKCERKAERCKCKASGDPHYTTYDKVIVHFMGICRYTLSQFKDPKGKCSYHAIVQNEKRKGKEYPSFTQYLQVKYQSTNVVLHKDGPGKQRVVEVNGQFLPSLPYVVAGSFRIVDTGRWIVMETLGDCDYVFKFDGDKKAMVDVPKPKSLSDYSGLCGNCDSTDNDWVTRDGTSVAKLKGKARYVAYGNGWALPGPDGKIPEMCLAKRKEPRCTSKMQKRFKKKNACGVLSDKKGIFEKALKDKALKKMAKDYVETCMQDMCLTEGSEDEQNDLLCSAVEEFANAAKDVNEDLIGEWRSESFCPMTCGRHEEFRLNDDGCQTDCLGVTACLDSPEDGCFCKEGYVRSGRDCVKADECGCKMEIKEGGEDMTLYLRPGDEFVMPRSCVTKMCMKPDNGPAVMKDVEGKTVCNKETSKCKKTTKGYKCRCKSGFESEDGYNCVPVVAQIEEQEDIPPPPAPEDPGTDIEEPPTQGEQPEQPEPPAPGQQSQPGPPGSQGNPAKPAQPPAPPAPPAPGQQPQPGPGPQQNEPPQQPQPGRPPQQPQPGRPPQQPQPGSGPQQEPAGPAPAQEPAGPGPAQEPAGPGPAQEPAGPGPAQEAAGPGPAQEPAGPGPAQEPAGPGPAQEPAGPGPAQEPAGPGPAQEPAGPGPAQEPAEPGPEQGPEGGAAPGGEPAPLEPADEPEVGAEAPEGGAVMPEGPEEPCPEVELTTPPDPTLPPPPPSGTPPKECKDRDDPRGERYIGTMSMTISGIPCQRWMDNAPHQHPWKHKLGHRENFCSNLPLHAGDTGKHDVFCITTDPNVPFQYCDVPFCDEVADETVKTATPLSDDQKGCYNVSDNGASYDGDVYYTEHGEKCDQWASHGQSFEANKCRNPMIVGLAAEASQTSPWCYVDSHPRKCDVPECETEPEKEPVKNKCNVKTVTKLCGTTTVLEGDCSITQQEADGCEFTVKRISEDLFRVYTSEKDYDVTVGNEAVFESCQSVFKMPTNDKLEVITPSCGGCMKAAFQQTMSPPNEPFTPPGPNGYCRR